MKTCFFFLAAILAMSVIPALAQPCPPSANWCSGTYQYDGMGNIRAIGNDTYIYDTAGRLVSGTADVQRTGVMSRQDYGYDAYGNRVSASRAPGSVDCLGGCEQSLVIDPATNHITSNGAVYDAAGNLIFIQNTINGTPYSATYTYDAVGRLTRATAGSDDRQFIYTADDERIAVKNGQNWTWTVRDLDGKVLREFTSLEQNGLPTANRQWAKDYIWRDSLLLATVAPTTPGASTTVTQHFHLDHIGTPRLITDGNGVQLGIHSYYPFGAELNLSSNEQPAELMKFTGHERDLLASNPNALDYMHARFYNPAMGRFLSVDPEMDLKKTLPNPQMWNRYAYVMNNPLRYTDPTGRESDPGELDGLDPQAISRFIGSALHLSALREAFSGIGSAPWNEKLMAGAIGVIAAADVGSNFLAPEKATAGVLLGENMTRVAGGAEKLALSTFKETGATFAETMAKNMKWLGNQVKSGARIFDIGLDASRGGRTGVFFKAEVAFMEKAGYTRKFVKLTQIEGKTYRVYEWIRQ